MCPIKRVQVVVLLVVVAALLACARADAAWTALTPTGAEPNASGEATKVGKLTFLGVERPFYLPFALWCYSGELAVQCHGLTPNATYTLSWSGLGWDGWWEFRTDEFGEAVSAGEVIVSALRKNGRCGVDVGVHRADGTLLLSGYVDF